MSSSFFPSLQTLCNVFRDVFELLISISTIGMFAAAASIAPFTMGLAEMPKRSSTLM